MKYGFMTNSTDLIYSLLVVIYVKLLLKIPVFCKITSASETIYI
jgi:hypothetical protein